MNDFFYRLAGARAHAGCPSIADLLADGWEIVSDPSPYGSVWMRRPA